MSSITKGFHIYIISDKNDISSIVNDLGLYAFVANKWTGTTSSNTYYVDNIDNSFFSTYVDEPTLVGNRISDLYTGDIFIERMQKIAPMTLIEFTTRYEGYYIMLAGNKSGYYAISTNAITSQGFAVSNYDLYDDSGIKVVSNATFPGVPLGNSTGFSNLLYTIEDSGLITSNSRIGILSVVAWDSDANRVAISFSNSALSADQLNWFNSLTTEAIEPEIGDPYELAGDSGAGDFPSGDFDYSSDHVGGGGSFVLPTISAVDTGFITLYNPTIGELKSLSDYLWSSSFDINTFKKIFNDPMELFIGLSLLPVQIPDGTYKEVGIGLVSSGVFMTVAASQFVKVDCGSCYIPNFTSGYLDYSPYTKVEVYLPYIGFRTLNADEVAGKTLQCTYMVDILSGSCTCWLDVISPLDESEPTNTEFQTTYVFMGECAVSIPMASGDWTSLINGIIGAAAAVGAGFAAGGVGGAIAGGVSAASSVAVNDSKIQVERSGAITSAGGLLAPQNPYVIITTPRIHKPADTPYYTGYPAYFTAALSDMSGFTTVDVIRLSGVPATENELTEIETLLKGGVIL